MQIALFWKQMQDYCYLLADCQVKSQVGIAIKYPEEKRLKVWTSKPFRCKALEFSSSWVALKIVCNVVYMEQIKNIQRDLYKYITENPTLTEKFMADFKSDQKALEEIDLKTQEEILALPPANSGKQLTNSLLYRD